MLLYHFYNQNGDLIDEQYFKTEEQANSYIEENEDIIFDYTTE